MRKFWLLFTGILIVFFCVPSNQKLKAGVAYPGEELVYRVSYIGITLGYINISTYTDDTIEGHKVIHAKAIMKSNSQIPFVDLDAIYESRMDTSMAFSRQFIGKVKLSDGTWDYNKIDFFVDSGTIHSEKWIRGKVFFNITYNTKEKYNDGLTLFFLARKYTKLGKIIKVPTIVDRDTVFTVLNFLNKVESSEIDAVNYPIKTVYFNGKAFWTGIYGLSGEFEGWFSDDDASIPITAKMKVYLGSVTLELVKWKRGNWMPPKY